uniref:hypothetical protein n=1 Tax=Escherichia coli TaxID=562 RepID=UPI001F4B5F86
RDANGARIQASQLYQADGFNRTWRDQIGPAIYKPGGATWSIADINALTTEFTLARNTTYGDVDVSEHYMVATYEEPLVTPTMSYPAPGATVD